MCMNHRVYLRHIWKSPNECHTAPLKVNQKEKDVGAAGILGIWAQM